MHVAHHVIYVITVPCEDEAYVTFSLRLLCNADNESSSHTDNSQILFLKKTKY